MSLPELYEADETAWLEQMSSLLQERRYEELDYEHLQEFLFDMARRDRREVLHRLTILLAHLLKWDRQPLNRSKSCELTVRNQRQELEDLLDSQTLRNHALAILPKAYERAVLHATAETGLEEEEFPKECPYALDVILSTE